MKKILLLVTLFLTIGLEAETIKADYKVEFGIFGEIGIANAVLEKGDNSYVIDVELEATGLAKTLSGGRTEHHISKGHMENGVMVTDLYQVIKSSGSKTTNKVYRVNHETKVVTKEYKRWKNAKLVKDTNSTLDFYSKDDLLTLYFNLNHKIEDKTKSDNYSFSAVGAEKQNGNVEIAIPEKSEYNEYKESVGESNDSWYARAIIHQDIFSSDKGELMLRIGNDGVTEKAVLKDLIFFGDIRAKRI